MSSKLENHKEPSFIEFSAALGRAFAGALIFALPMLMTMEMWSLGFYLDPWRLVLLLAVTLPLLFGLSRLGGLRPTVHWLDDVADVLVAIFVATIAAAITLFLFGEISVDTSVREVIGKLALQIVPGSIGAMLASSQLGQQKEGDGDLEKNGPSYGVELFLMGVGALFLSFNVAPTEEMILLAYQMSVWQELGLLVLSLVLMHVFIYAVNFRGGSAPAKGKMLVSLFARYTVVGYAIVLLTSLAVLWFFGRTDGTALEEILSTTVVLSFPGAIGAAAARLIL
jgi:putative integral membrane protein (TIGR02587 family)